ncbi:hypothetical protein C0993_008368 [Termitomyces sp. T159_Od127]|nr:hypothetical protein C0993_008368 [Termitomyces sp. T159_Od127]
MADKNLQEGDEGELALSKYIFQLFTIESVSWKWGTSEPTGTVAEIKTEGKLEIETKGKLVHKNADPSNPAVHVERAGNDVVKRASELTKLSSSAEGDSAEAPSGGEHAEAYTTSEHQGGVSEKDKQESTGKQAQKKRSPRKKSNAGASTGQKREAEEAAGGAEGAVEESPGKRAKKSKTTKGGDGSEKKGPGRPRKDSKAHKAQDEKGTEGKATDVGASAVSAEGISASKKKAGRPKKSDASDHPPSEDVPITADAPAANTRSKD